MAKETFFEQPAGAVAGVVCPQAKTAVPSRKMIILRVFTPLEPPLISSFI
jgi:hypothetical protein